MHQMVSSGIIYDIIMGIVKETYHNHLVHCQIPKWAVLLYLLQPFLTCIFCIFGEFSVHLIFIQFWKKNYNNPKWPPKNQNMTYVHSTSMGKFSKMYLMPSKQNILKH